MVAATVTAGVDTVATGVDTVTAGAVAVTAGVVAVTLVVTAGAVTVAVVTGVDSVIGASPNAAGRLVANTDAAKNPPAARQAKATTLRVTSLRAAETIAADRHRRVIPHLTFSTCGGHQTPPNG